MNDYKYNSSATSMLQELGWKTLEDRRKAIDLVMMYKIVNNAVDIPTSPFIEYNCSIMWFHTVTRLDSRESMQISDT